MPVDWEVVPAVEELAWLVEEMALEEMEGQLEVPMPFVQIAHGERYPTVS